MINLLYCGNEKVFDGLMISLLSIIRHTSAPICAYIMTMDLTSQDARYVPIPKTETDYLNEILQEANPLSRAIRLDATAPFVQTMGKSVNLNTSYTPYTLLRLCADMIPEIPDRILYLDTDTVANRDISLLWNIDISLYELAGVKDYLGKWFIRYNYINAGVLYLNIEEIRRSGLFARAREMCNERKMSFPDQSAINTLAAAKLYLPPIFNEQRAYHSDTVIQHFSKSIRWLPFFHTINVKPWQVNEVHEQLRLHAYDDVLADYQQRIITVQRMEN